MWAHGLNLKTFIKPVLAKISDSARAKVLLELARAKVFSSKSLLEQKIETFILMFLIIILVKLVQKNHYK
jgi:hypothetical protein